MRFHAGYSIKHTHLLNQVNPYRPVHLRNLY